jgi:hypothetical protein
VSAVASAEFAGSFFLKEPQQQQLQEFINSCPTEKFMFPSLQKKQSDLQNPRTLLGLGL